MKNTQVTLVCTICGVEFKRKKSHVRESNTCSKPCGDKQKAQRAYQRMCDTVGEDFKTWLYREYITNLKSTRQIAEVAYGSSKNNSSIQRWLISCGIEARRGSEAVKTQWINNEERRALSAKQIVLNRTPEVIERLKTTMRSSEYRLKQSKGKTGSNNGMYGVTGENHPQWNPDRTHEQRIKERKTLQYSNWRKSVYEKDGYKCKICGDSTGGNLVAHHLHSYSKEPTRRYETTNGMTLCNNCHNLYHTTYGWRNANPEDFCDFIIKMKLQE